MVLLIKINMKKTILLFIAILSFASCNNDTSRVEKLETEVLAVHDEVMPRMDNIMSLQSKLKKKLTELDSLQLSGISSNTIAEERMKIADLYKNLGVADSLMMDWMHQYDGDSAKSLPVQEAIGYFELERQRIQEVKVITNKSIEEAETFFNN